MKTLSLFLALLFLSAPAFSAPASTDFQPKTRYDKTATITIASSTTVSDAIDLYGTELVGIFIPSTFDGTALTLTASNAIDGTYVAVDIDHTSASAYTITSTASRYVPISNLHIMAGLRFLKIVTSTAQTTTDTVFILATKAM